jgi:gluconolactonase
VSRIKILLCSCLYAIAVSTTASEKHDLNFEVFDDRFYEYIDVGGQVEVLATDLGWAEGPVWSNKLRSLLFSDVAKDRIYRWSESAGISEFLYPSGHSPDGQLTEWRGSNGLAIDNNGNLLLAQQGSRVLARMVNGLENPQANFETLASHYKKQRINSPNDLLVHPSGDIYFTDPPYGLSGFEKSPDIELGFFGVFQLAVSGQLIPIHTALEKPNGLALSLDSNTLYVSNSETGREKIISIDLKSKNLATRSTLLFDASHLGSSMPGSTDGMSLHRAGILFATLPGGFGLLTPKGELLGTISLGQVTNLAFDTEYANLYLTAPHKLLRIKIKS